MPFEGRIRSTFFMLYITVYKQIKFNRLIIKLGFNKQCLNIVNNFNYYDCTAEETNYKIGVFPFRLSCKFQVKMYAKVPRRNGNLVDKERWQLATLQLQLNKLS